MPKTGADTLPDCLDQPFVSSIHPRSAITCMVNSWVEHGRFALRSVASTIRAASPL